MNSFTTPKVLLIVDLDSNTRGVGELFLRDLASFYPRGRLIRYSLVPRPISSGTESWLGFPLRNRRIPAQTRVPIVSSLRQWKFNLFQSHQIAYDIENIIKSEQIDLIWAVLNSPEMICLTRRLMNALNIQFITTIWDTPEHFSHNLNIDAFTARATLKIYADVLSKSSRVSVMSERMKSIFENHYDANAIVMRHGIHPDIVQADFPKKRASKDFVIGFAGNLYCKREWNALLKSIYLSGAVIDGHRLKIRFIGRFPRFGAKKANFLEFKGLMSFADTIRELSRADAAYVPYWFDHKHSHMAKSAFPSKISAYAAARIPILYHGPKDSTPTDFFDKYPLGLCCHSMKPSEILQSVRSILIDQEIRNTAALACKRALEEELGLYIMLRRFAELIGIDRERLLPLHVQV